MKCQVQWVDAKTGLPTPDTNEATCKATLQFWYSDGSSSITSYPCCAQHEKQLDQFVKVGRQTAVDGETGRALYHSQWTKEAL